MKDYPLCPYCVKPLWDDQPQYNGWHSWCDEQTAPKEHYAAWLWASNGTQPVRVESHRH